MRFKSTFKSIKFWAFVLLFLVAPRLEAASLHQLSARQIEVMNKALLIGEEYHAGPEVAAIAWQESSLGVHKVGGDGRSLGVGNMRLSTARWIIHSVKGFKPWRHMNNKQLTREIVRNDDLSIRLTAWYYARCVRWARGNKANALRCYNGGPGVLKNPEASQDYLAYCTPKLWVAKHYQQSARFKQVVFQHNVLLTVAKVKTKLQKFTSSNTILNLLAMEIPS